MEIYYNVPLAGNTTFGIGGPARIFIEAERADDIADVLKACKKTGTVLKVLGGGSNVLASDEGYDGTVLRIGRGFEKIETDGETVKAEAGARLSRIAFEAEKAGLTGLEWAAHIPGTLGGALFMNAGAFGSDMSDVTQTVFAADSGGNISGYCGAGCGFSYRSSVFQRAGGIITGAELKLKKGRAGDIRRLTEEYLRRRKSSQPYGERSAGSVFKSANGVPAAKYIDALGLKGRAEGGAQISYKHANFIVNKGGAACRDVLKLIEYIKEKVLGAYGIRLETEIRLF